MIISFGLFLLLLFFLNHVGEVLSNLFKIEPNDYSFIQKQLLAFATICALGSLFVFLEAPRWFYWLLIIIFSVSPIFRNYGLGPKQFTVKSLQSTVHFLKTNPISLFPVTGYLVLWQPGYFTNKWTYRIGPDSFGWSDAILYFRSSDLIRSLTSRVSTHIHGGNVIDSLSLGRQVSTTAIQQIASFTDQIQAEFLLGAHRTGMPFFIGSLSSIFPRQIFGNLEAATAAWSLFVLAGVGAVFITKRTNSKWIIVFTVLAIAFNINLLSTSLEGGFGQLIATPFLIFPIVLLVEKTKNWTQIWWSISFLAAFALSSYLDILYVAVPIIFVGFTVKFLGGDRRKAFNVPVMTLIPISMSLIGILTSIYRLVISPLRFPTLGGWDQGRKPMLINLIGMLSDLPHGFYKIEDRTILSKVFELGISIVLVVWLASIMNKKSPAFAVWVTFLLGYLLLYKSVYSVQAPYNNYRLWKYSGYFATVFPFLLMSERNIQNYPNRIPRISPVLQKRMSVVLLFAVFVATLSWSTDWLSSRKEILSNKDVTLVQLLSKKYDLLFTGNLYPAMYSMYGDVRYVASYRIPNLPTQRSIPKRDLVILFPKGTSCKNLKCLSKASGVRDAAITATGEMFGEEFDVVITKIQHISQQ